MSSRRKISVRKVIQTLVTILVVTGCTMAILSADRLQRQEKIRQVRVHIRDSRIVRFLDEEEVMHMLFTNRHLDPKKASLARLDIHSMEVIARSNPWISEAQVFVDNDRNLNIYLSQRIPVVRVFETDGNSYYMDAALKAMPLSDRYAHYTPIVTNVPLLKEDSLSRDIKGQIISLVQYISGHKFWNAQISQIVMTPDRTFELIPVIGHQRILLGDTARLEEKLNNLFAFYQQVSNKLGWDKYQQLDLRYQGQVIASPSLPWKIPVDRALSNMNWVKAIMDAAPQNEKDEAADNNTDPAAGATASAAILPKPAPLAAQPAKAPDREKSPVPSRPAIKVSQPVPYAVARPKLKASPPLKKPAIKPAPLPKRAAAEKPGKEHPTKKNKPHTTTP